MSNKNSSKNAQSPQVAATRVAASSYMGPIPPASEMMKYAEIDPSLPDRIMTMAEKQSAHRHKVEQIVTETYARNSSRGVMFAFILAMTMLLIGGYCIIRLNKDILGVLFGTAGIGSIVGTFVYGTHSNRAGRDKSKNV